MVKLGCETRLGSPNSTADPLQDRWTQARPQGECREVQNGAVQLWASNTQHQAGKDSS